MVHPATGRIETHVMMLVSTVAVVSTFLCDAVRPVLMLTQTTELQ